ncbi:succinylglutamate desuccinylase/aspartoacylase family protein [Candidatus Woesebacteria bacterium]|nr:succinylglutamate desuccinylase/aspartoacylase family protein [Candidatus Woesebacteria bacterium]
METSPKGLFISATHGDEGFSQDVMEQISKEYPSEKFRYDWITGNPPALAQGVRFLKQDLNRIAPGDAMSDVYEVQRAAAIMALSKEYSYVIDIHGTVADTGIVTIIPFPSLRNLFLASLVPVVRNVIWYAEASKVAGPLVQFTQCPGIEIECGPKSSLQISEQLQQVIAGFLENNLNMTLPEVLRTLALKEFYYVYGRQTQDGRTYKDFELVKNDEEEFYPFLSNQYPGIACYKMRRAEVVNQFLANDTV